ncbi:MAG: hypothetical protein ACFFD4_11655 [Candidatus Odinarchaeota archaeon]
MDSIKLRSPGFLLDIDGCITLADAAELHAKADPEAVEMLVNLFENNHPVALITGRSIGWVRENVFVTYPDQLPFPVFMEYGWLWWSKGKLYMENSEFREKMSPFLRTLERRAASEGIIYHPEPRSSSPADGGMWNEDKQVMVSIAANYNAPKDKVHSLIRGFINDLDIPPHRVVLHHLGLDILPADSSKKAAALNGRNLLDPKHQVKEWFVFGDSKSDKEMVEAFDPATEEVQFINTSKGASKTVKVTLLNYTKPRENNRF